MIDPSEHFSQNVEELHFIQFESMIEQDSH